MTGSVWMASSEYSFIDIAVLDAVRARFAAGHALAILSADLEEVIWANGPGAKLFGFPDIEAIMGASAGLGFAQRRQIAATTGFPRIGTDRPLLVRLASGVTSRAIPFLASSVTLPDGEVGILLAAPPAAGDDRNPGELARLAISGFSEAGYFAALLSGATVVAATPGFQALGIETKTVDGLVADVADAQDRLVKRLIPAASGRIPAGIARLTDEPGMHLLVAVDDPDLYHHDDFFEGDEEPDPKALQERGLPQGESGPGRSPWTPASPAAELPDVGDDTADSWSPEVAPEAHAGAEDEVSPEHRTGIDRWYFEADAAAAADAQEEPPPASSSEPVASVGEEGLPAPDEGPAPVIEETESAPEETQPALEDAENISVPRSPAPATEYRNTAPVRFAWRTDAVGNFSSISPEFLIAVGAAETAVIGRSFAQVAEHFGMDPGHEIAGLLERRDTWSGRTVLWPIEGTDLAAPVDLAALPVYARNRSFEGFRGFGIARLGDAVAAPRPPTLLPNVSAAEEIPAPEAEEPVPAADDGNKPAQAAPSDDVVDSAEAGLIATDEPETAPAAPADPAPESSDDPFRGETPVIAIEEARYRRYSDKIIRLAEHRPNQPERGLSPVERNAFREIGDRLKEVTQPSARQPESERAAENGETLADTEPVAPPIPVDQVPPQKAEEDTTVLPLLSDATSRSDEPEANDPRLVEELPYIEVEEELFDEPLPPEQPASDADAGDGQAPIPHEEERAPALPEEVAFDGDRLPARHAGHVFDGQAYESREEVEDVAAQGFQAPESDDVDMEDVSLQPVDGATAASQGGDGEVDAAGIEEVSEDVGQPDPVDPAVQPETHGPADLPFLPSAVSSLVSDAPAPDADAEVLSRLPLPLLIHRGDRLLFANRAFCELTGYESLDDLEESGGLGELFLEPYQSETEDGEPARGTVLSTKAGHTIPVRAHLQSVPWMGGKALLLALSPLEVAPPLPVASGPDEESATGFGDRVEEMRTILDTATDGVVLITPEGMIRSISRPAEALFGYEDKEVAGKPFAVLFAVESQRAARDYLESLSENGVASVLNDGREVIGREAQGRFIPLFMTIGRLPGGNGYCAVMRDITQWKRAEEELTHARALAERASSQKSEFLARVSHEIRTPLNAIIGFSELMMDEKFGPMGNDRYRDYLRDINRSGNHVLDLVNDLLDLSKIEAGEQEMAYEAVSLNDVLAETVAMMQPQANRERVIIRSSFASRLPEVVADLRSIRQIGLNLLSNAVRFTQPGGQVIVSTSCEATGDVVMRVRDTGVGMSAAEIEQALKPFKQINSLKRKRTDGTGLGLPLTKAMVEANRARFAINSAPGEGTLVEVTFPSARVLAG